MSSLQSVSGDFAIDQRVVALEVDFLVNALPVAAAVVHIDGNDDYSVKASNSLFCELQSKITVNGNVHPLIITQAELGAVINGHDADAQSFCFTWQSNEGVDPRQLDISIAFLSSDETHKKYLISFVDRTSELQVRRNLHREMLSDSLTGLYNRTGFEEAVEEAVEKIVAPQPASAFAKQSRYAIFAVDLARFRQVNECAGAIVGDELILTVASRLRNVIRDNDILGRMGGNEFGIFVRLDNGVDDIPAISARIASIFDEPYNLANLTVSVSAAMGIAIDSHDSKDPSDHIRHAQIALKEAKISGRIEHYSKAALDFSRNRFVLENDLRKVLDNDGLEMAYQPLIDLATDKVIGFEALARWNHPERGAIPPSEFIPIAEECGLIVPLGRWALFEAAKTLKSWDVRSFDKYGARISVNLSATQFAHDDVAFAVEQAIRNNELSGNRLTLELTESAIISDPDRAKKVMEALKSLDTTLAMDDFGTGYSNLEYLQKLPIDILKIDRSFVTPMLQDRDRVAIVRAVLSLANALGMETTAEGIETKEISSTLAALGCSNGQGYYYARPLSADQAYDFMKNSSH